MHIFSQHDGTGTPHYTGFNTCLHTTHTTSPRGLPHLQSVYQLGSPLEPEFKEHFAGGDLESDLDYRFRYSNTIASPPTDCACTSATRQLVRFSNSNTLLPPSSHTRLSTGRCPTVLKETPMSLLQIIKGDSGRHTTPHTHT